MMVLRPRAVGSVSNRNCGTCVVLPQPVSPACKQAQRCFEFICKNHFFKCNKATGVQHFSNYFDNVPVTMTARLACIALMIVSFILHAGKRRLLSSIAGFTFASLAAAWAGLSAAVALAAGGVQKEGPVNEFFTLFFLEFLLLLVVALLSLEVVADTPPVAADETLSDDSAVPAVLSGAGVRVSSTPAGALELSFPPPVLSAESAEWSPRK
jgi:hypothetical protein